MKIGDVEVEITPTRIRWTSGFSVDADGSPRAYAPRGSGLPALDDLRNAGTPNHWYGIFAVPETVGEPVIQGPNDPWPGYYVSTTALSDHSKRQSDPTRYVDSEVVPYIAIPPELLRVGVHKGDVAFVKYFDKMSTAIVADIGPHGAIGEGSIALAMQLGMDCRARNGGVSKGVEYTIFPGSSKGWPRTFEDIDAQARALFGPI